MDTAADAVGYVKHVVYGCGTGGSNDNLYGEDNTVNTLRALVRATSAMVEVSSVGGGKGGGKGGSKGGAGTHGGNMYGGGSVHGGSVTHGSNGSEGQSVSSQSISVPRSVITPLNTVEMIKLLNGYDR